MTTRVEKAPTILTRTRARRLTARIRDALVLADDLLVQAWEGRAWEALDYESWAAYCEAELPQLRTIKALPPDERANTWADMVRAGLSMGAVAEGSGVGKATISRALSGKELPVTATGLDGKVRSTRRATVPSRNSSPAPQPAEQPVPAVGALTRWQVVVQHVTSRGLGGATCLEFEDKAEWRHGAASGAFYAAERKGHIVRDGRFRDRYAVYVAP